MKVEPLYFSLLIDHLWRLKVLVEFEENLSSNYRWYCDGHKHLTVTSYTHLPAEPVYNENGEPIVGGSGKARFELTYNPLYYKSNFNVRFQYATPYDYSPTINYDLSLFGRDTVRLLRKAMRSAKKNVPSGEFVDLKNCDPKTAKYLSKITPFTSTTNGADNE